VVAGLGYVDLPLAIRAVVARHEVTGLSGPNVETL